MRSLPEATQNHLLAALPNVTRKRWLRQLERVEMGRKNMTQFAYAEVALGSSGGDVAVEDWDDLFRAVTGRLARLVRSAQFSTPASRAEDSAVSGTSVLECVEALEQLRSTMTHELGRRRQADDPSGCIRGHEADPLTLTSIKTGPRPSV